MSTNSSFKQVLDEKGRFVWNVAEYNGRVYCPFAGDLAERIESFKTKPFPVREDDIYLLTYPKCGTHWVWEILMMLIRGSAEHRPEHKVEFMLEIGFNAEASQEESRRIVNTHLRYDDTPSAILDNVRGKVIQVHRNPADVAVSFYHHLKKEVKATALSYDWDDFISKLYCDPEKMAQGTWFDYTCEWWTHCNKNPNYLAVFYEELKEDPVKVISEVADFIEVKLDQDLLQKIVAQTEFHKMKEGKREKEDAVLSIIFPQGYTMYRKGVVGDWRNHFTKEQHQQLMESFNQQLQHFPELHQKYIKYLQW